MDITIWLQKNGGCVMTLQQLFCIRLLVVKWSLFSR
jgi:hypothetical protein